MSNSSLATYKLLSPNHSGQRTMQIDRITPHCVVGQLSAAGICGCFTSSSVQASCNYGIGKDGDIGLCVEEKNRSCRHICGNAVDGLAGLLSLSDNDGRQGRCRVLCQGERNLALQGDQGAEVFRGGICRREDARRT